MITYNSTSRYLKRQEFWARPFFVSAAKYVVRSFDRNRRHSFDEVFSVVFIKAKIIKHANKSRTFFPVNSNTAH